MFKHYKGFTINFFVSLIAVISVSITLIISAMVGYQSNKNSLVSNTLELNRINAEKLAITANDLLTSAKKTLVTVAEHLSDSQIDNSQFNLDLIKSSSSLFNSVFIVSREGIVLNTEPENLGLLGKKLNSAAASKAIEGKRPLISEPYIGITGRFIIMVSQPIFDDKGAYAGFVGGTIYLNEPNVFETMLGTQTHNVSGSYIFVATKKGELLYHPEKERIGDIVTENDVVQSVLRGEKGESSVRNTQNITMLAGYAPVHETGWGIISQTPATSAISASKDLVFKIFMYSIPILLIVLVLVIIMALYFSRPLYKLANFAEKLSRADNYAPRVPQIHNWNYEANELHKTIEKAVSSMQSQINVLSVEAHKDKLTGLNNRRTMDEVLNDWGAGQVPFSYIILDIDHFKVVNDTYGHPMGDEVLKFLAGQLIEHTGIVDVCCRYGGEEFVILSPGLDTEASYLLAEKIRKVIEQTVSPIGKPVTISIGIASNLDNREDVEDVKQRADAALYKSKEAGRNKVSRG